MSKEVNIDIDGYNVRYFEKGTGKPVVILHGASFNAEIWVKTGTLDAIAASGWWPISVDMPGFGKTERGGYDTVASFLDRVFGKLGIEKAVIAGASLGGREALAFSVKYPQRVIGLVLVGAVSVWMYEDMLERIKGVPALLIWGSEDNISPKENYQTIMKHLTNSRLAIIGKIHPCYLEEPAKFNKELTDFLKSITA
ncbi:MAG: alpha/beta hydrolase [Nitrososphaerota archaeon]|jgi:pimeloyl-ACP methyl ester carboxylesterase|nr:alpha/beta hydrolase [Nitrososphaerota archaeon]MDG6931367.1 alpha/beta hydrolase [Nitrososphaerota archaeon]